MDTFIIEQLLKNHCDQNKIGFDDLKADVFNAFYGGAVSMFAFLTKELCENNDTEYRTVLADIYNKIEEESFFRVIQNACIQFSQNELNDGQNNLQS